MLQISITDINALTLEQRKVLAGFLLSYPTPTFAGSPEDSISETTASAIEDIDPNALFSRPQEQAAIAGPTITIPTPAVTVAVTPTATAVSAPTVDKAGFIWDARIHSSNKELTDKGVWRKRRAVSPAVVAEVEGELRQLAAIPVQSNVISMPVQAPPPPPIQAPPPPTPAVQEPVAIAPVAPAPPTALPVPSTLIDLTVFTGDMPGFLKLIGECTKYKAAGKITQDEIDGICAAQGIPNFTMISGRTDLVPLVAGHIFALIATRA